MPRVHEQSSDVGRYGIGDGNFAYDFEPPATSRSSLDIFKATVVQTIRNETIDVITTQPMTVRRSFGAVLLTTALFADANVMGIEHALNGL